MKPIFGILFATLLTVTPSTTWAQYPTFDYDREVGAKTDISAGVYNPGVTACPPDASFGWESALGDPARQTGGDGVWATMDADALNTAGRTALGYALADANGFARAYATADTSAPCSSTFMSATGISHALFYRRYTVGALPTSPQMHLHWALQGSFSHLSSTSWGGHASLRISLLPAGRSSINPVTLAAADLFAYTGAGNYTYCFANSCKPVPQTPVVNSAGTIDVLAAFQAATRGRAMATGDSFIIVAILDVSAQTCGFQPGCPVPTFTTDFGVSTRLRTEIELLR